MRMALGEINFARSGFRKNDFQRFDGDSVHKFLAVLLPDLAICQLEDRLLFFTI